MNRSAWCAAAVGIVIVSSPARTEAQSATLGDEETEALIQGFDRDEQAFEAAIGQQPDCEVACRAFESMRRSAERLCELDPGERCSAARAKVEAAATRLQELCPECDEAQRELLADEGRAEHDEPDEAPASAPEPGSAPPSESKRGTCAACTIGADGGQDEETAGFFTLLAVAAAALRRRRR